VTFDDAVRGTQRFETEGIGDFVIRRADGTPAFFFCNAVDDALMGVTDVLRAEDHLSNTPRQLLLLDALGLSAPRYAHVSLLVDDAGVPLSKREGSLSLAALREAGYLPLALCNYLARLGHHYREADCLGLDALAAGFDRRSLGAAPARFDAGQLSHWQGAALAREPSEGIWAWMGEATRRWVPEGRGEAFVRAVRGNVRLPAEAEAWARRLFDADLDMEAQAWAVLAAAGAAFLHGALASLAESGNDFRAFAARLGALTGLTGRGLFGPLRAALTGRLEGPELGQIYALLGHEGVGKRLRQALGRGAAAGPGGHDNG
jgi:glutamyl-tRNA synthetase